MRDVEILAQQFADKVGIGVRGIEQFDPVALGVTLGGEFTDFGFALRQHVRVFG